MEGREEVKKIVEEREYAMVRTRRRAHNTQRAVLPDPQFSRAGLGPKETALILAGLVETGTWRYVPLPCQLSENRNQRLQRGNRRRDRVERDYFIYRSRSRLPLSP